MFFYKQEVPTVHSYDEALSSSIVYFCGNELAAKVFVDKYAMRDISGNILEATPTDMHKRLAREFARIEKKKYKDGALTEDEIFDCLDHFKYIVPQGSILAGVGNTHQFVTLSNCYVVESPHDSYGGILYTDEQLVQISKRRGGVGINLSNLRPNGSATTNSARSSTGVVSFANRYSNTLREVAQNGRRGAGLLLLNVHHPEVVDFAKCKADKTKVTGANISVQLTDEFMDAVKSNSTYEQRWPINSNVPEIVKEVSASEVWDEIIRNAHEHAEPGLIFWDKIISESPADCYKHEGFETIGCNPCSEVSMSKNDSCRLMLLNMFAFVVHPFTNKAYFDYSLYYKYAKIAQRLMDDMIDLELECIKRIMIKIENDPEPLYIKQRELDLWEGVRIACEKGRRVGIGDTGLADTMAALNIAYSSEEAVEFAARTAQTLKFACYESSIEMAEKLGPFPIFDAGVETQCPFFQRFKQEVCVLQDRKIKGNELMARMAKSGRRNIACLTRSPAGSMSILTQTTSGIEPLYFMTSMRRKKGNPNDEGFRTDFVDNNGDAWMEFEVLHPQVIEWMKIADETDLTKSPWHGNCAEDLDWKIRLRVQSAIQQHVDHSISSTINLPSETTVDEIKQIYEMAHKLGLKGITVYRKGCRDGVILERGVDSDKKNAIIKAEGRPKTLPCNVHHTTVKGQQYFVLVGLKDGGPYEVFAGKNGFIPKNVERGTITRKKKNFYVATFEGADEELSPITAATNEMEEVVTRLTSLSLRSGANMHTVVQQLEKVGERQELHSFARCISRVLKKYIPDGTNEWEKCPECQGEVIRQEGCCICKGCGYSKCL